MQSQTEVTAKGRGSSVDAKRPTGSTSHGVCLLRGSFVGDAMPGFD